MEAEVIKAFTDSQTAKIYRIGEPFPGTVERIKELQEKGFLKKPETKK